MCTTASCVLTSVTTLADSWMCYGACLSLTWYIQQVMISLYELGNHQHKNIPDHLQVKQLGSFKIVINRIIFFHSLNLCIFFKIFSNLHLEKKKDRKKNQRHKVEAKSSSEVAQKSMVDSRDKGGPVETLNTTPPSQDVQELQSLLLVKKAEILQQHEGMMLEKCVIVYSIHDKQET